MFLSRWLKPTTKPCTNKDRRRFRPTVEGMEVRVNPADVGDTLGAALATGLGPTAGTYTMPNQDIGDGRFGALDVDLYRVDARAGQVIRATTSAPGNANNTANTLLSLFDAAGTRLAVNDDIDYSGTGFSRIDQQVTADGTYYVGVSGSGDYYYDPAYAGSGSTGSTGNYRLDLTLFTPVADAAGDTLATALDTGVGPTSAPYSTTAQIGDGLYLGKDVDVYKFTADPFQLLTVTTAQPAGGQAMTTYLRLFDATRTQVGGSYNYESYGTITNFQLTAGGTYYLAVSGYPNTYYDTTVGGSGSSYYYGGFSTGDYQLSLSLQTLPLDAVGDTLATAADTGLNQAAGTYTNTTRLGDGRYLGRDVDLYKVQAAAGQAVTVTTSQPAGGQSTSTYLRLFDAAGSVLAVSPNYYSYGNLAGYTFNTAGTYYVGVSLLNNSNYNPTVAGSGYYGYGPGDYTIGVNLFTPTADAAGDTLATARATGLGPTLGTLSATTAAIGDGLYLSKDVDLYKFTAQAGQGFVAVTSAPSAGPAVNPVLRLFDATGQQLAYDSYSNGTFNRFKYLIPADGTYYLGVSGSSNGNYNPTVGGSGTYYGYYGGATGGYNLDLSLVTPTLDAAGDTIATAAAGVGPAAATVTLVGSIGDNFFEKKDVDLYRIDVQAGQVLSAETALPAGGTATATWLRLFRADGQQLFTSGPYYYPPYSAYAAYRSTGSTRRGRITSGSRTGPTARTTRPRRAAGSMRTPPGTTPSR